MEVDDVNLNGMNTSYSSLQVEAKDVKQEALNVIDTSITHLTEKLKNVGTNEFDKIRAKKDTRDLRELKSFRKRISKCHIRTGKDALNVQNRMAKHLNKMGLHSISGMALFENKVENLDKKIKELVSHMTTALPPKKELGFFQKRQINSIHKLLYVKSPHKAKVSDIGKALHRLESFLKKHPDLFPQKTESPAPVVSELVLQCPPHHQASFDLVPKKIVAEVFNSPHHTAAEKERLFGIASEIFTDGEKIVGPGDMTSPQVTLYYLHSLAAKYPQFHVFEGSNPFQQWEDGTWRDDHRLIDCFAQPMVQAQLPAKLSNEPCIYGYSLQVDAAHRTAFIIDFQNRTVEFFNSYHGDSTVKSQFEQIAKMLSQKYGASFTYVVKTKGIQLQKDAHQCGIWACKLLEERVVQGEKFNPVSLKKEDIASYRKDVFSSDIDYAFHLKIGQQRFKAYLRETLPSDAPPDFISRFFRTPCFSIDLYYHWSKSGKTDEVPPRLVAAWEDFKNDRVVPEPKGEKPAPDIEAEVIIQEPVPEPEVAKEIMSFREQLGEAAVRKPELDRSVRTRSMPFYQIRCLDQRSGAGAEGMSSCGYHALKNGMAALGVAQGTLSPEAFTQRQIYTEIQGYVSQTSAVGGHDDASIAVLTNGWREMRAHPTDESLRQVASTPSNLSMLNYYADMFEDYPSIVVGGEAGLPFLANICEVRNKLQAEEPFQHAFLVGSDGHWTTLILDKDPSGQVSWYGLDSWGNNTNRFQEHLDVLERVLMGDLTRAAYNDSAGDTLNRRAANLSEDGQPVDQDARDMLTGEENIKKYVTRIKYAVDFMDRAGWLTEPETYNQEIETIQKLTRFYMNNRPDHPDVQDAAAKLGIASL